MFKIDTFDYWLDWLMRHPQLETIQHGQAFRVILPCGRKRVDCWEYGRGSMRIYFDVKAPLSFIDKAGEVFFKDEWIEHRDDGPSMFEDNGKVRYKIYGEDITEGEFKRQRVLSLLKEVIDEEG